ncbi:hypothetical protein C0J52_02873 [Blattella germanica]|nr:hypothetical protein C0J52_02873 [Blattella germanica]
MHFLDFLQFLFHRFAAFCLFSQITQLESAHSKIVFEPNSYSGLSKKKIYTTFPTSKTAKEKAFTFRNIFATQDAKDFDSKEISFFETPEFMKRKAG